MLASAVAVAGGCADEPEPLGPPYAPARPALPGAQGRSCTWRRSLQADRAIELHFFPGAAEAQDAAHVVEPVVGSPDESVLDGVRALGPVLVVYYSFFIADRPGGVGIEEDLVEELVEPACARPDT